MVNHSSDFLGAIKNILECTGYTVKIWHRTDNTFNDIGDFGPDLIIMDIFLPCEDGNRDSRVLVFSTSLNYLEDYNRYSLDDFIEKPFTINHLMEKIKSVLHRQFIPRNVAE